MVFVVEDIIVIFRKIKTILVVISFKLYFSHPEKSILNKSSLTLRRHRNSRPRSVFDPSISSPSNSLSLHDDTVLLVFWLFLGFNLGLFIPGNLFV